MKKIIPCLCLLLYVQIQFAFAQTEDWDKPASRSLREAAIPGLIATGEVLLKNAVLMTCNISFNRAFGGGFEWAQPSAESIRRNFTTPIWNWKWEEMDRFPVNQLGHPYQGAMYFTAGRVNGFGPLGSILFGAFGSYTWEVFFENPMSSLNDFITTTIGSFAMGEMLYRLHIEAHTAGAPLPVVFLVNPMGGFHMIVTNGRQIPDAGQYLYQLQTRIGGGYAATRYSFADNDAHGFFPPVSGGFGNFELRLIYGNPFEQHTAVPFRHFELTVSIAMRPGDYIDYRMISDGYLFSFSPVYTDRNRMSTGLSLHFDYISIGRFDVWSSGIDMHSNALGWSVKHRHDFSENTAMELKYHAGFTFWGVSSFYSNHNPAGELNYGYGFNSKLFFNLENKNLGRLEAELLFYSLWPYPGTSSLSGGSTFWLFSEITYSRLITNSFSIGATKSFAREWTSLNGYPNTTKKMNAVKMFIARNF
ncbi:MAG: DUF3943 domain-containing protein [Spirochaetes bacterium]|nr:DUF3943 domain-containing protein [Spirochaetota bacterium]